MSLRSEVESTRDRFSSDLKKAHDYYSHTKVAWRIVHLQIEQGTKFQVQNINTGSEVSEAQFLELSRRYITQELPIASLQQYVAIFEGFLSEVVRLWLATYPKSLSGKQLKGSEIFDLPDKTAIISALVEKELKDIFYDRPIEWFNYLRTLVNLDISETDRNQFSEIKATRDVLVHGHGIANAHYIDKAGRSARVQSGQPLDVTEPYHQASWELICRLTREIGDGMAAKAR